MEDLNKPDSQGDDTEFNFDNPEVIVPASELTKVADQGHLTLVDTLYYGHPLYQPVVVEARQAQPVRGNTQPYQRVFNVEDSWQPLPLGWYSKEELLKSINSAIKESTKLNVDKLTGKLADKLADKLSTALPSTLLLLRNDGTSPIELTWQHRFEEQQTNDQAKRDMHSPKYVYPALRPLLLLLPGRVQRLEPVMPDDILLRCPTGKARCTLWVFAK